MGERIALAMSGGVDSSVSAHLLREGGFEVVGLFMCSGLGGEPDLPTRVKTCCAPGDLSDARRVAHDLGIPFHAVKLGEAFAEIIDYFCGEYLRGRTPNPCIRCNRQLKFGRLLEEARKLGCNRIATGHYAGCDQVEGRYRLLRGRDSAKDQSYFLFELSQEQLEAARFPLAELTKKEVRKIAARLDLHVRDKPESQEVCLVPDNDYAGLLSRLHPDEIHPGEMVDTAGNVVGRHKGIAFYTIGQRRGLGVAFGQPRYVVELDARANRVVVGPVEALLKSELVAEQINWVSIAPSESSFEARVQIRYRHPGAPARLTVRADGAVHVAFQTPQRAITPGQAAVFYDGNVVLGGGWIA